MADIAQLELALRNADAAGDEAAARTIAAAIKAQTATPKGTQSGFAMGLADPIHGGAQLLTKLLPEGVVQAGNKFNNWLADRTGLVAKLPEGGVDQQVREREQAYQAQRGSDGVDWGRLAGNVLNPANLASARAVPMAATTAGRIAAGAAAGGAASALSPVGTGDFADEKLKQMGAGAAAGGLAPAAGAALKRVISPNASTNEALALLRAEGIKPTVGQALGGLANKMEEKAISLPIVGDSIAAARQRAAGDLNTAVANRALGPIGAKAPADLQGRELVSSVQKTLSDAYETLLPKLTVKADQSFAQEVSSLRGMVANGSIDPNAAKTFQRILQSDVLGKFKGQNALTGRTLKDIESDLGQKIAQFGGSTDADARLVADALREVQSSLRSLVQRNNPQFADELKAINAGWANFKRMERAAGYVGAEDGVFSAAQLQSAIKAAERSKGKFARGDALMQDLGDAAKSVLGSKVPNSGTADRMMNAGAIAASAVNPGVPIGLLGGTLAYSAPVQRLLLDAVSKRPAAAKDIAGLLNNSAPMFSPALGLLGVQAINQQ